MMRKLPFVFLVVAALAGCSTTSIRRSEDHTRQRLLLQTPLGTKADVVLELVKNDTKREATDREPYYDTTRGGTRRWTVPLSAKTHGDRSRQERVGTRSIDVCLGGYHWATIRWFYFKTYVYVTWCFNNQDELIDILVYKEEDSL